MAKNTMNLKEIQRNLANSGKRGLAAVLSLFMGATVVTSALTHTSCKPTVDPGNEKPAEPITVTFNIPSELTNLNKTKPVTIVFPANFYATRLVTRHY